MNMRSSSMGAKGSWTAFGLLMALAIAAMVTKKFMVCSWIRRRNPAAAVSEIGGLLGAVACEASPSIWVKQLWWTPTLLDVIGVPYLLILAWAGIREIMSAEDRS
ncbi:MAG TPA: hypothetical protein VJW20_10755 [Candidatus Angelobacter sp.]|nr:hypothetical protein [Candidatus Angelobacter sp.]